MPLSQRSPRRSTDRRSIAGYKAVIAEDEGLTQAQLNLILSAAGMDVAGVASNGKRCVELALEQRPDLVLLDICMPEMDGLDACEQILQVYTPCIVVLSAFSDDEYLDRARRLGASGYVVKPIAEQMLLDELDSTFKLWLQGR